MRILVADDEENIRKSLKWLLEKEGHTVLVCANGEQAIELTEKESPDLVFMDIKMPGMGGLAALEKLVALQPDLKVFMISGHADISVAVRATKLGAYDFLEKPLNPEKVLLEIKKLLEREKVSAQVKALRQLVELDYRMIGDSPAMQELFDIIDRAAPSEGRILIYGENGTGKELVAREIHNKSLRKNRPFVQLNCAALPNELIESELFGYEKGAFTGAFKRKLGLIEQADGGTLLLDEVGDMALETQAKLLRVLQENEFYRVGSTTPKKFNVRIISATNKDLSSEIAQGRFREDLYFRLNVIPIRVPPLREHSEDIPALVDHFLNSFCRKSGKKVKRVTDAAIDALKQYHWPGNIRELKNIMERLAIMTSGDEITRKDVEAVLGPPLHPPIGSQYSQTIPEELSLKEQLARTEKQILLRAFEKYNGNVTHMAIALKTDRANLHKKLKKYKIK